MELVHNIRAKILYYDPRVWYLFVARVINATGFAIVLPFLSIYLNLEMGVPMSVVGAIFLFAAVSRALFQYIGGELSDRWGRKTIMLIGSAGRAITFFLLGWVVYLGGNYLLIGIGVMSSYGFGAMFFPAADAMVADVAGSADRVEVYAIQRIGVNLGWAVGPAIGGLLSYLPFYLLFVITGVFFTLTFLFVLVFVRESVGDTERRAGESRLRINIREMKTFLLFCMFVLMVFSVMTQIVSTLSVFSVDVTGISKIQVGFLFTINGLFIVLFQFHISKIVRRVSLSHALSFGAVLNALGCLLVPFAPGFWTLGLAVVFITFGEMFVTPSGAALVSRWAPEREKGRYFGVYGLFMSFGRSIGPFYGGILLDHLRDQALLLWGAIAGVALTAAAGFLRMKKYIPAFADRAGTGGGNPPHRIERSGTGRDGRSMQYL